MLEPGVKLLYFYYKIQSLANTTSRVRLQMCGLGTSQSEGGIFLGDLLIILSASLGVLVKNRFLDSIPYPLSPDQSGQFENPPS